MWIRKNENEFNKAEFGNNEKKILYCLGFFVIVSLLLIILYKIYGGYIHLPMGYSNNHSQNLGDSITKIPAGLFISFILIFLACYLIFTGSKKVKKYICDKCNMIEDHLEKPDCKCGGTFVDLSIMKWVDENEVKK